MSDAKTSSLTIAVVVPWLLTLVTLGFGGLKYLIDQRHANESRIAEQQ
ncbi:hypothetical protein PY650_24395 [Rhizobium calliandrae]|uniref:Uncharacterized protein n=1 Tax=Rhizobium calliandrae TaxID=1312182 RepID=A0ABT7KN99_9HYPH|nr:hypothetical protein [Rhizobium calliandrae]MDL2408724.1 hypothetical protein [Rhizobium calliandrae]